MPQNVRMSCKTYNIRSQKYKIGPKLMNCVFIRYAYNNIVNQFLVYKSSIKDIHHNVIME